MKKLKYGDRITFSKVSDYMFNAEPENIEDFKFTLTSILESISVGPIENISSLMDLVIGEELTSRIVVDSFVTKHKDFIVNCNNPILINFILGDNVYKITIGYNSDKLGGIVYSLI